MQMNASYEQRHGGWMEALSFVAGRDAASPDSNQVSSQQRLKALQPLSRMAQASKKKAAAGASPVLVSRARTSWLVTGGGKWVMVLLLLRVCRCCWTRRNGTCSVCLEIRERAWEAHEQCGDRSEGNEGFDDPPLTYPSLDDFPIFHSLLLRPLNDFRKPKRRPRVGTANGSSHSMSDVCCYEQ